MLTLDGAIRKSPLNELATLGQSWLPHVVRTTDQSKERLMDRDPNRVNILTSVGFGGIAVVLALLIVFYLILS